MPKKSIPSPFDSTLHKTERSAVSILVHWMRNIMDENNIDLGPPDVETVDKKRKMPDTVIYRSKRSKKTLCVIEAKLPYYDVFNEELKEDALRKANRNKAEYFVTTNFRQFIWWKTKKANDPNLTEEQQIIEKFSLSEIENVDDIEQVRYKEPIKKALNDFLSKLYKVSTGVEQVPKLAIDEFLIFRLQEKIRVLSKYYKILIEEQCHKDSKFARKLKIWFVDQGWSFGWQAVDFDRAAHQTAYLLINKILFYNLLQAKRPNELDILEIPESLTKGSGLENLLQFNLR